MQIILATGNKDKIREIKNFFKDIDIDFLSLSDIPNAPSVIEDCATLQSNAIKKAKEIALFTGKLTLADDSGLEVDALNGAPGVYSARFAGENVTYHDNNLKLLRLLKNVPAEKRTAHFSTVLALVDPTGKTITVKGKCNGIILTELKGTKGFGYDPLFYVPELKKTFAELSLEQKNKISHRSKALQKMHKILANQKPKTGN